MRIDYMAYTMDEMRKKERKYRMGMLEGGDGYNPWSDAIDKRVRYEMDQEELRFAAEWTIEVTDARRAEWNNRVRSGEFGAHGAKVDARKLATQVMAAEKAQGWTLNDLKRARKIHGSK